MKKYLPFIALLAWNPISLTYAETPVSTEHELETRKLLEQAVQYYQQQDYIRALEQFKLADQAGHFKAARYLGLMYLHGEGVEKDLDKAIRFFEKSANLGDLTSQYWLGYLYENGMGVIRNWQKAEDYYRLSAVRGLTDDCAAETHCNPAVSAPAMFALAQLSEKQGKRSQAIDYYRRATNMGDENIAKTAKTALQRLESKAQQ